MSDLIDLDQVRADAAVGAALRRARTAERSEPLFHVSWVRPDGRSDGGYLGDPRLGMARAAFAQAADDLLNALAEAPARSEEGKP